MFLLKSLKLEQTKKSLGLYHRSYAQLGVMRTELGNYKAVKDRCIFSLHLYLGLYGFLVLLCSDQMFHSPFDLGKLVPLVFSMSTWPQKDIPGSTQDNLFKHHYDLTMVSVSVGIFLAQQCASFQTASCPWSNPLCHWETKPL